MITSGSRRARNNVEMGRLRQVRSQFLRTSAHVCRQKRFMLLLVVGHSERELDETTSSDNKICWVFRYTKTLFYRLTAL